MDAVQQEVTDIFIRTRALLKGHFVLRRGFTFKPGEKVLVVEDVITRGGRVQECLDIVKKMGGTTVAVAVLVDRSTGLAKFDVPTYSLLEMSYPTYPADQVPPELAKLPASKPGS